MFKSLQFFAGRKAQEILSRDGLKQEQIEIIAGAAGGPKWLVLSQIDRALFGSWLTPRKRPLYLLGSSIGSWRFAAAVQPDPIKAIEQFERSYSSQRYANKPSPEQVTQESMRVLDGFISDEATQKILTHPYFRLNIIAVKCKNFLRSERLPLLWTGLFSAVAANTIHRNLLNGFMERTVFTDSRDLPPFLQSDRYNATAVGLKANWLKRALMASGSIPMVMAGVYDLPGFQGSCFRDGGLLDYHMDIPYCVADNRLVLFPHFSSRIIPGWLDKYLSWRRPNQENLDNVLMVCPSPEFIATLPGKKIPDRNDFYEFMNRDDAREVQWRKIICECRRLHDELLDVLTKDRINEVVQAIPI